MCPRALDTTTRPLPLLPHLRKIPPYSNILRHQETICIVITRITKYAWVLEGVVPCLPQRGLLRAYSVGTRPRTRGFFPHPEGPTLLDHLRIVELPQIRRAPLHIQLALVGPAAPFMREGRPPLLG